MRVPCQRVQVGRGTSSSGNSKSCPAPSRAAALAPAHRSMGLARQRAAERTHGRGTVLCCHEVGTWAATKPRYARAGSSQTCSRPPSFAQDAFVSPRRLRFPKTPSFAQGPSFFFVGWKLESREEGARHRWTHESSLARERTGILKGQSVTTRSGAGPRRAHRPTREAPASLSHRLNSAAANVTPT